MSFLGSGSNKDQPLLFFDRHDFLLLVFAILYHSLAFFLVRLKYLEPFSSTPEAAINRIMAASKANEFINDMRLVYSINLKGHFFELYYPLYPFFLKIFRIISLKSWNFCGFLSTTFFSFLSGYFCRRFFITYKYPSPFVGTVLFLTIPLKGSLGHLICCNYCLFMIFIFLCLIGKRNKDWILISIGLFGATLTDECGVILSICILMFVFQSGHKIFRKYKLFILFSSLVSFAILIMWNMNSFHSIFPQISIHRQIGVLPLPQFWTNLKDIGTLREFYSDFYVVAINFLGIVFTLYFDKTIGFFCLIGSLISITFPQFYLKIAPFEFLSIFIGFSFVFDNQVYVKNLLIVGIFYGIFSYLINISSIPLLCQGNVLSLEAGNCF